MSNDTNNDTPFAGAILTITVAVDSDKIIAACRERYGDQEFTDEQISDLIDHDFGRGNLVSYVKALGKAATMDPIGTDPQSEDGKDIVSVIAENATIRPEVISVEAFPVTRQRGETFANVRKRFAEGIVTERLVGECNNNDDDLGALKVLAGKVKEIDPSHPFAKIAGEVASKYDDTPTGPTLAEIMRGAFS